MAWKDGTGHHRIDRDRRSESLGDLFAPNTKLLEEFKPDYFTACDIFPASPHRVTGVYRLGTAEAELSLTHGGESYELEIKSVNIDDARKLHEEIRAGKIWPVVSYEEAQTPKPVCRIRQWGQSVAKFFSESGWPKRF